MAIGELLVIDAEEMQEGGVEVVDVHGFVLGREAKYIAPPSIRPPRSARERRG